MQVCLLYFLSVSWVKAYSSFAAPRKEWILLPQIYVDLGILKMDSNLIVTSQWFNSKIKIKGWFNIVVFDVLHVLLEFQMGALTNKA